MERRLVMKVDQQKEGAIYAALSYMMMGSCADLLEVPSGSRCNRNFSSEGIMVFRVHAGFIDVHEKMAGVSRLCQKHNGQSENSYGITNGRHCLLQPIGECSYGPLISGRILDTSLDIISIRSSVYYWE